jgi:hypothetical protein
MKKLSGIILVSMGAGFLLSEGIVATLGVYYPPWNLIIIAAIIIAGHFLVITAE